MLMPRDSWIAPWRKVKVMSLRHQCTKAMSLSGSRRGMKKLGRCEGTSKETAAPCLSVSLPLAVTCSVGGF